MASATSDWPVLPAILFATGVLAVGVVLTVFVHPLSGLGLLPLMQAIERFVPIIIRGTDGNVEDAEKTK